MQRKISLVAAWWAVLALVGGLVFGRSAGVLAQGEDPAGPAEAQQAGLAGGFTYQGRLVGGGSPVNGTCDFQFSLHTALSGGQQLGATQTVLNVAVSSGLFTVTLNQANQFGPSAFSGAPRWLAIAVRCPAGSGGYTPLSPRQPLTPAPYALSLPGLAVQHNDQSPNLVGGHISNTVTSGVVGATISGGGSGGSGGVLNSANRVTDSFGTVGGGVGNQAGNANGNTGDASNATVGGGSDNVASGIYATVGGGGSNQAGAWGATVAGGTDNRALADDATVAGGTGNEATGASSTIGGGLYSEATMTSSVVAGGQYNYAGNLAATVGGGQNNSATGQSSTVPGGDGNHAVGNYSLAAGRSAWALHQGSFVWADSTPATFESTAANQFLIRAAGGVGIGTTSPANALHVVEAINLDATPQNHVAQIVNTAAGLSPDVLALRVSNASASPPNSVNFITFFSGTISLGSIEGNGVGGVTFAGPGNDFAEYLPKQAAGLALAPGSIVGVRDGRVSLNTGGADQVLVISTAPIVAGNLSADADRDSLALVALVGQALVQVRGPLAAGDFIVPSGLHDGAGLAFAPEALSAEQAAQIVGQAMESADGQGPHAVKVAVGLPRDQVWARLLAARDQALEARLAALEERLDQGLPAAAAPATAGRPAAQLPWLLLGGLLALNAWGRFRPRR